MNTSFARSLGAHSWSIGNDQFKLVVALRQDGLPVVEHLTLGGSEFDWAPAHLDYPVGPVVEAGNPAVVLRPGEGLALAGVEVEASPTRLSLRFASEIGLSVTQHFAPSPDKAVVRSWVTLSNESSSAISGITRFDAAHLVFQFGPAEPQAGYVLGWMEGPRADAPGYPPLPFKYGGWIPKFLYGENFVIPPPPAGGWSAPVYRLVQERLTQLPLRSGKRSTYQNHPWLTVLDTQRQGGFFLGFEWSGTWKIDAGHTPDDHTVSVRACTDANAHTLKPGETLESPAAFVGLFAGDWDDAFNACRRYVGDEIIPKVKPITPTSLHVYWMHDKYHSDEAIRREIDAAAEAGFETTYVEARWWDRSADEGDFSIGLGDFTDSRKKFPMGLKGMSDYVHSKGMNMGLWFEFERVDLRTANQGPLPWRPEWLVQQRGHPYRSWCQHVFMLCLGVKAAAEWALENMTRAIEAYGIDYVMIDSNEWAVCDDPTHDHGAADAEWAQTQGMYFVLRSLRERFPNLMLLNSAGGSQRGDFGMARYSTCMHPHDNCHPSAKQRRFLHGTGCMYPSSFQAQNFGDYRLAPGELGWAVAQPQPPGVFSDLKRLEWRGLNRLMGYFITTMEVSALPAEHRAQLKKLNQTYQQIRACANGDRYVLAGPRTLVEPEYLEADNWEVYEQVSPDRDRIAVFFYRCLSTEPEFTAVLRGLDAGAIYHAETYSGRPARDVSGAELMTHGYTCRLEMPRSADIVILSRC